MFLLFNNSRIFSENWNISSVNDFKTTGFFVWKLQIRHRISNSTIFVLPFWRCKIINNSNFWPISLPSPWQNGRASDFGSVGQIDGGPLGGPGAKIFFLFFCWEMMLDASWWPQYTLWMQQQVFTSKIGLKNNVLLIYSCWELLRCSLSA